MAKRPLEFGWEEKVPLCMQNLDSGLLRRLVQGGWDNPMVLQAGFDDLASAEDLIRDVSMPSFDGQAVQDKWALSLLDWSREQGDAVHRQRRRLAHSGFAERESTRDGKLTGGGMAVFDVLSSSIVPFCTERRWRSTRTHKLSLAATATERMDVENEERLRWTYCIVTVLHEAKLPSALQASLAKDPDAALRRVVGRRRSRTLRTRYKTWVKIRLWLQCVYQVSWPAHLGMLLDYIADVALGPVPRSLPGSLAASLSFLEKIGGVLESQMFSKQQIWLAQIASLTRDAQVNNTEVKRAPQPFIAMIISLELYVKSGRPKYRRALAWLKLVRIWATMRSDDTQGIDVRRLTLSGMGLSGVLTQTKTTGAGKKVLEVMFYVIRQASFTGLDWLQEGFDIWTSQPFQFNRDFFLPLPKPDWETPSHKMANYSAMSALNRSLLLDLSAVRKLNHRWREVAVTKLIQPPGHLFWTEHSDRHFTVSASAVMGVSESDRDDLGRWGINAQKSNAYRLTSRQVVFKIQALLMKNISEGPSDYEETDLQMEYERFMQSRNPNWDGTEEMARLTVLIDYGPQINTLDQRWPLDPEGSPVLISLDNHPAERQNPTALLIPAEDSADEVIQQGQPFWMSTTRSGFRRLHRVGGCRVVPEDCWRFQFLHGFELTVENQKADKACRICFKGLNVETSDSDRLPSESSGSSSTESSEEDEPSAQQPVSDEVVEPLIVDAEAVSASDDGFD